jgi:Tfp pilus assembly pilus retraction ATPase PilT
MSTDMPKIDVFLRSIERFGAAGAVLTSGQAVTLKFPAGDRNATQVVAHDQLVMMVREIAPAPSLDQIDGNKPARFDYESSGFRYILSIAPKPGSWQVTIDGSPAGAGAAVVPAAATLSVGSAPVRTPRAASAPVIDAGDLAIERGQYAAEAATTSAPATSGSGFLDALTHAARGQRASDLYLTVGIAPLVRAGGDLRVLERAGQTKIDAETLSRELGIVASAQARNAWTERGTATFAYGDGMGRVRVTLSRDQQGPGAALRMLVAEPPALDRIGLPAEVPGWLERRGLVLVAGGTGVGKTTALAALVRHLGEQARRVITLEDPIELVHPPGPWISQRQIGDHVTTVGAGVAAAMREGADVIVVGHVTSPEDAVAVTEAVAGGHLVLAIIAVAQDVVSHLVELLPAERREIGRRTVQRGFLGAVVGAGQGANRRFEAVGRPD